MVSSRRRGRPPLSPAVDAAQRRRILDAAGAVFARRGFRTAEVQEVADAAGVGKASVYRRWPSKEALFHAAVADGSRRMLDHVLAALDAVADPMAKLRAGVRAYLAWWDAEPGLMELLMLERSEFPARQRARTRRQLARADAAGGAVFQRLVRAGVVRDLPPRRLVEALGDRLYGLIYFERLGGRRHRPPDAMADEVVDLFLHGILTPAGRRREHRP